MNIKQMLPGESPPGLEYRAEVEEVFTKEKNY